MGASSSSRTVPVLLSQMTCEDIAQLAEADRKTEVAKIVRENEIDGALIEELDDEMMEEMCPGKLQRHRLSKARQQLLDFCKPKNDAEREHGSKKAEAEKDAVREHGAAVKAGGLQGKFVVGSWLYIPTSYIMDLSDDEPLPECRTLLAAGILRRVPKRSQEELMRGEGFEKILIISHRWEDPTHPDPACTKLKELKKLLPTRPDIEGVWLDFTCLPQGDKDKEEHDFFDYALSNVNLLYLSGKVLVFLDKEYVGRFWPSYEFFLCSHRASREGLVPKSKTEFERRVEILAIGASKYSNGMDEKAIIETWRDQTATKAVEILSQDDMKVTNKKDKLKLLPKLLEFEQWVMEMPIDAFIDAAWTDAAIRVAVLPGGFVIGDVVYATTTHSKGVTYTYGCAGKITGRADPPHQDSKVEVRWDKSGSKVDMEVFQVSKSVPGVLPGGYNANEVVYATTTHSNGEMYTTGCTGKVNGRADPPNEETHVEIKWDHSGKRCDMLLSKISKSKPMEVEDGLPGGYAVGDVVYATRSHTDGKTYVYGGAGKVSGRADPPNQASHVEVKWESGSRIDMRQENISKTKLTALPGGYAVGDVVYATRSHSDGKTYVFGGSGKVSGRADPPNQDTHIEITWENNSRCDVRQESISKTKPAALPGGYAVGDVVYAVKTHSDKVYVLGGMGKVSGQADPPNQNTKIEVKWDNGNCVDMLLENISQNEP